jgi:lipopolysaccharide transport system permease protein
MNDELQVIVYSSDPQTRTPLLLLESMLKDLLASKELAWRLFVRDLSAQYRQSILGILWAFIPPIITSLIFIVMQSRNIINFQSTDIPYPVYVLVGMMIWQIFTESLNAPLRSVTASKPMLAKINFPREAIIISSLYLVLFNAFVKLLIIAVILFVFDVPFTWKLLPAILAILMLIVLGIGIGVLLTPFGMLYSDVITGLPILISLWFFLTPVVYPPPDSPPLSLLAIINPVSPLLIAARDFITIGSITNTQACLIVSGLAIVGLAIAWVWYRVTMPVIIERMSA